MSTGSGRGLGINSRPIGQVPSSTAGRQVQMNATIIGAIPTTGGGAAPRTGVPAPVISKRPAPFVPKLSQQTSVLKDDAQASVAKVTKTTELKDNRMPFLKPKAAGSQDRRPSLSPSKQGDETHLKMPVPVPVPVPAHTIRSAAGETWQDPTLADWDPSMHRPLCPLF